MRAMTNPVPRGARLSNPRIAVVGGGIAGVSIAYELAAEAQVVLFEMEAQLAYHTTGRSAAKYLQSIGNPVVRTLTAASAVHFERFPRELETPALLKPRAQLWIADAEASPQLDALLEIGDPVQPLSISQAVELCPALRAERLTGAALDVSGQEIDVMALHQGYVRGLLRRGGEICRGTPVVALQRARGGWVVQSSDGSLAADAVVDAAGAWADRVAEMAGVQPAGIRPLRRTILTSSVHWPSPIHVWPFVSDCGQRFYFTAEHDQVLVSPADETPDVPRDVRPAEEDIARAIDIVNRFTTLGLRHVRTAWAGLRSFAADRSPVVGFRSGEPGFFWFAGQGGYGIQMAPALARAGAALLLHGQMPEDLEGRVEPSELCPDRLELPGDSL